MALQSIAMVLGWCVIICHAYAPLAGLRGLLPRKPWNSGKSSYQRLRHVQPLSAVSGAFAPYAASFELTRSLYFRALGSVYFVAFLIAKNQNKGLIGDHGLQPARHFLSSTEAMPITERPISLLYAVKDKSKLDGWLDGFALAGLALAAVPVVAPQYAVVPVWAALWTLYHSLDTVGGPFYSFMWESQLLETGFLAMCAAPLWFGMAPGPAWFNVAANRWLLFRIMIGAGLIKIRGDSCWKCWKSDQPSCLEYHYETQPVPGPLASLLHSCPKWFHRGGTGTNHLVELVLPWLLLLPPLTPALARAGAVGGAAQLVFSAGADLQWELVVFECTHDGARHLGDE
jgi:hypothetical protein